MSYVTILCIPSSLHCKIFEGKSYTCLFLSPVSLSPGTWCTGAPQMHVQQTPQRWSPIHPSSCCHLMTTTIVIIILAFHILYLIDDKRKVHICIPTYHLEVGRTTIIPQLCKLKLKENCDLPRAYSKKYGPVQTCCASRCPKVIAQRGLEGTQGRAVGLLRPKTPEGNTETKLDFL